MKSLQMMLAGTLVLMATPAVAASEMETGTTIVWVALAVVAIGALAAVFGSVLLAKSGDREAGIED